ncbi:MAG: drug/metabolite transporter (DMT)-like permease [Candidatus Endobugula sp.]|jgi:drug/metabolite transporter (DMT)-like permease
MCKRGATYRVTSFITPQTLSIRARYMQQRLPVIILLLSSIGWGLTWIPIKTIQQMGLPAEQLIFIAFSSAAIALLPWMYRQRHLWLPAIGLMLLLSVFGGFANMAFQTAMAKGDVIRVTILFYMLPVWSMLGGWWILNERVDRRRMCALFFCLGGAVCILEAWQVSWTTFTVVDALALGSGLGLAASNILFRFTANIPLASKIGFMFIGCVIFIGFSLWVFPPVEAAITLVTSDTTDITPLIFASIYGLCWIMLITVGSQWAVTRIEASRSAIIIVMELVVAIGSVIIITQSQLTTNELIGGIMVFIAALLEGFRVEESKQDATAISLAPNQP